MRADGPLMSVEREVCVEQVEQILGAQRETFQQQYVEIYRVVITAFPFYQSIADQGAE